MKPILFNEPAITGNELGFIKNLLESKEFSGLYFYEKKCQFLIKKLINANTVYLTPSGTHSLELAAMLINLKKNDEVIMPSYTFSSTANAFVLHGAKIVFIDVDKDTMNIDLNKLEKAITKKTKAIVPVHYSGNSCDMKKLMKIAKKNNIYVIEDSAQAFLSKYNNKYLGNYGDIGCFSFHQTKNIHCSEGGAITINNPKLINRAEILREKGTNRSKFYRGEINKYNWVDIGSSYIPSEISNAFLYGQLLNAKKITNHRIKLWKRYEKNLKILTKNNLIKLNKISKNCKPNGHIFFIKLKNSTERNNLIIFLKKHNVESTFHYIPLHSTRIGKKIGFFNGNDDFTSLESLKLLRLPLHYKLTDKEVDYVSKLIINFFNN